MREPLAHGVCNITGPGSGLEQPRRRGLEHRAELMRQGWWRGESPRSLHWVPSTAGEILGGIRLYAPPLRQAAGNPHHESAFPFGLCLDQSDCAFEWAPVALTIHSGDSFC